MPTLCRNLALVAVLSALGTLAVVTSNGSEPAASAATGTHYIVNGQPGSIGQFPYYAGVLINTSGSRASRFYCGGSVLTPTIVITAGHCTYSHISQSTWDPLFASDLNALVGTDSLLAGGSEVHVIAITRHPGYNPSLSNDNDLALLTLSRAVNIRPLKVVGAGSDFRWASGAPAATIPGFGCSISNSSCRAASDYPVHLRQATLRVQTSAYCSSRLGGYEFNPSTMLCAGMPSDSPYTAPGPCFGDSGGPLTVAGPNGRALLIGLVSWGVICGGEPTAFTRVARYRSWLATNGVPIEEPAFATGPRGPSGTGIPVAGDFNGDHFTDLFVYRPGSGAEQTFNGASNGVFNPAPTFPINGVYSPIACDLNFDGVSDLVLYGGSAGTEVELFGHATGTPFSGGAVLTIKGQYTVVAGDFNGDGFCDLLLYRPGAGSDYVLLGTGSGNFGAGPPIVVNGHYLPVVGDFNHDGRSDVLWYAPGSSPDYLWLGQADGHFSAGFGVAINGLYLPVAGDFNGDGFSDLLLYAPGAGADYLLRGSAHGFVAAPEVSIPWSYTPVAGDFNGDGRSDVVWYAPSGGSAEWLGLG
jgi:secreted trypsin-like serine protease